MEKKKLAENLPIPIWDPLRVKGGTTEGLASDRMVPDLMTRLPVQRYKYIYQGYRGGLE